MSLSKAQIYNLALGALLLTRRTTDPTTDTSNEVRTLNTVWQVALESTIADLDLDSTSQDVTLELLEEDPDDDWGFLYAYPTNCVLFRRIKSCAGPSPDNKSTHVPKRIKLQDGDRVVFTNEADAVAEIQKSDIDLGVLNAQAGLALAYRLASLASPLIVGKGAKTLRDEIDAKYVIAKAEAQEVDGRENFNYNDDRIDSEFVDERTS